ncbi:facilitated trehalose transporter Tret1-2 homolog [Planococcus citri]|uniref:facilitated trehalose transporter Tret1-2 homolog n=1 Tax=Planococcus citri TaxID=170843 RepID=UPI0031F86F6D
MIFKSISDMSCDFFQKCCKTHIYVSLLVSQLSLFSGFTHAYSAILIPQLTDPSSSLQIHSSEASWIASFGTICRPVGAFFEGLIIEKYGRKRCIQISTALHACSWIYLSFSCDILSIYFCRILTGLATGMEYSAGIYMIEVSPTSQRGTLLSLMAPITATGTLITYILGYLLSWRLTSLIFGIYALLMLILQLFIYDTPIWYTIKNQKHQALRSLLWLRGDNRSQVKNELEDLEMKIQMHKDSQTKYLKRFTDRSVWKPFMILLIFSIFQKSAGQDAIFAYAVNFFSLFRTNIQQNVLSIIFAIISLIGSMNIVLLVHKFNRTTILLYSGLGMSISLAIGAIFLEFNQTLITVCCIFMYIYCCMSGMMSVPYMIIGESFPYHVRGVMGAAVSVFMFLPSFFNIKLFLTLTEILQPFGLLCYYSFFALCAAVFSKLFIVETRGKTLDEITEEYAN